MITWLYNLSISNGTWFSKKIQLNLIRSIWQLGLITFMTLMVVFWVWADVTSLGYTIGKTDYMAARKLSPTLKEYGINKYSKGKMLKGLDKSWNIRGLKSTTLIFDSKDKLTVIIMNMDKNQFSRVIGYLSKKYSLKSKVVPFVGNKSAVFRKDNVIIKVNSPHLSFNMDVIYSTNTFERDYRRIRKREKQLTNKHQESQF